MAASPRSGADRRVDTLAILSELHADTWVATASTTGVAHLVPLSFAWTEGRVVLALPADSATARNVLGSGRARLGFGRTRDVVMMDATLDDSVAIGEAPVALADAYAGQADWDPRQSKGAYVYLVLQPRRIQAWRESNELAGRVLMHDGEWQV